METQKTATAINDLIIINNDRYEGYKKAADEIKDADLKSMFTEFSNQSRQFAAELKKFVPESKDAAGHETKNSGKLYRIWMDFRAAVSDHDHKAILSSCEFGEDAAKKTYEDAIEHSGDLPAGARETIRKQRADLQKAHDTVKSMRDAIL